MAGLNGIKLYSIFTYHYSKSSPGGYISLSPKSSFQQINPEKIGQFKKWAISFTTGRVSNTFGRTIRLSLTIKRFRSTAGAYDSSHLDAGPFHPSFIPYLPPWVHTRTNLYLLLSVFVVLPFCNPLESGFIFITLFNAKHVTKPA